MALSLFSPRARGALARTVGAGHFFIRATRERGAGGYLTEPVGAVEDCQVCPRQTLGAACLTILGSWSISIRSKATRLCEAAASA